MVCIWLVRLESELPPSASVKEIVANRVPLLLQGMLYARSISNLIQDTINLHSYLGSPLNKKILSSLCQLIETVKSIESAYDEKQALIADNMPYVLQHLTFSLAAILIPARDRLTAAKKFNDKILDGIAALNLLVSCLEGPQTNERLTIAQLAFCIVQQLVRIRIAWPPSFFLSHYSSLLFFCLFRKCSGTRRSPRSRTFSARLKTWPFFRTSELIYPFFTY